MKFEDFSAGQEITFCGVRCRVQRLEISTLPGFSQRVWVASVPEHAVDFEVPFWLWHAITPGWEDVTTNSPATESVPVRPPIGEVARRVRCSLVGADRGFVGMNEADGRIIVYMNISRDRWRGPVPAVVEGWPVDWRWNIGRPVPLPDAGDTL
jgi:hypothetical protein